MLNAQVKLNFVDPNFWLLARRWCESDDNLRTCTPQSPKADRRRWLLAPPQSMNEGFSSDASGSAPTLTSESQQEDTANRQQGHSSSLTMASSDREALLQLAVLFRRFVPFVIASASDATAQNLCNAVGAVAAIGHTDERLFQACADQFLRLLRTNRVVPQDVANMSTAFSRTADLQNNALVLALAQYRYLQLGSSKTPSATSSTKAVSGMRPFELSAYYNALAVFYHYHGRNKEAKSAEIARAIEKTFHDFQNDIFLDPPASTSELAVALNAYAKIFSQKQASQSAFQPPTVTLYNAESVLPSPPSSAANADASTSNKIELSAEDSLSDSIVKRILLHRPQLFQGVPFVLAFGACASLRIDFARDAKIMQRWRAGFHNLENCTSLDALHTSTLVSGLARMRQSTYTQEWLRLALEQMVGSSNGAHPLKVDGADHAPLRKSERRFRPNSGLNELTTKRAAMFPSVAAVLFHALSSLLSRMAPELKAEKFSDSGRVVKSTNEACSDPGDESLATSLGEDGNTSNGVTSASNPTRHANRRPVLCRKLYSTVLQRCLEDLRFDNKEPERLRRQMLQGAMHFFLCSDGLHTHMPLKLIKELHRKVGYAMPTTASAQDQTADIAKRHGGEQQSFHSDIVAAVRNVQGGGEQSLRTQTPEIVSSFGNLQTEVSIYGVYWLDIVVTP
ncbi:unnamed protein product [Amoebophrya sp. A25]|nr:unnamed protein product [Amoebophrya sp. A25]|eukprot:GSA25T00001545001.1